MEGQAKLQKLQVDGFWSRIINAQEEEAITRCIDVFNKLVNSGSSQLDRSLYLGLVYVAKVRSELFCKQELSLRVLAPTLKPMMDGGKDMLLPLLACNLLLKGYQNIPDWPLDFVQMFLLDSFGARTWVDHDLAASFVAGIVTAFRDKVGPDSRYRDTAAKDKIRTAALGLLRNNIDRQENVRGLVRAVTALSTYDECRALGARRLVTGGWVQDPNLVRQVKDLFEALCARTTLDSPSDTETVRLLLSPSLSSMSQSYLTEHRTKLLANNPNYPSLALSFALSDPVFVADTVKCALAAFPTEPARSRVAGSLLFQMCVNQYQFQQQQQQQALPLKQTPPVPPVAPEDAARRMLTAFNRLQRLELCTGLFQVVQGPPLPQDVAVRVEQTYRTIMSFQLPNELSESMRTIVTDIMAVAAQWGARIQAPISSMQNLLFLMPGDITGPFASLPCTDAILDAVSFGPMSSDRLNTICNLLMRSARVGQLRLTPEFAPIFVDRVSKGSDNWVAALAIAVAAVLAPQAVGATAIAHASVRRLIMMLVTRRFVADVPTYVLAQLQSVPSLAQMASRTRDPDFVVMTMQNDPDAMQTAPMWLPQLLAAGDASFLNGLPADAALKTLLVATKGGSSSPLQPHQALLASKIDLRHNSVAALLIEHLLHLNSGERNAACSALALCQGQFAVAESLRLMQGALQIETDPRRLAIVLQRCTFGEGSVAHAAGEAAMTILKRRTGLKKCIVSNVDLQMALLRLAATSGAESDALLLLLPQESRLHPEAVALWKQVKRSSSFADALKPPTFEGKEAAKKSKLDSGWWMAPVDVPKKIEKQETVPTPLVTPPPAPEWASHPGVIADLQLPLLSVSSVEAPVAAVNASRNAVLCLMNGSPLAPLACRALLRYAPDPTTSTALVQFAASKRPVDAEAIVAGCKEASTAALELALEALLSVPLNSAAPGFEKRVRRLYDIVQSSPRLSSWAALNAGTFRKLLATRGGMSWQEAERRVSLLGYHTATVDFDRVASRATDSMQSEDAAKREEAYDALFASLAQASDDVKELVVCEWRLATCSSNLHIIKVPESIFYFCLAWF